MTNAITPKQIKTFFGYDKLTDFSKDWKTVTDEDKAEIREGIAAGIASGEIDEDGTLMLVKEGKLVLTALV